MIEAFEVARTKSSKKPEKRKVGPGGGEPKAKRKDGERPRGFDRCLDPERIIGDYQKDYSTNLVIGIGVGSSINR